MIFFPDASIAGVVEPIAESTADSTSFLVLDRVLEPMFFCSLDLAPRRQSAFKVERTSSSVANPSSMGTCSSSIP